jgi:hypothetical protein
MPLLRRFWSTDRSLTVLLALLCLVIFVIEPLGNLGVTGRVLLSLFFSLILISGVGAVAKNPLTTASVGVLVLTSLVIRWLQFSFGGPALELLNAVCSALFCAILAVVVLAQVFREGPITSYRIQGAIAVYLLLGLAWAFVYEVIDLHWPGAFVPAAAMGASAPDDASSRFIYFSLVTLTTVGYGDITAMHPVARSLVTLEALIGQLFPAILLARLVSMEVYYRQAANTKK